MGVPGSRCAAQLRQFLAAPKREIPDKIDPAIVADDHVSVSDGRRVVLEGDVALFEANDLGGAVLDFRVALILEIEPPSYLADATLRRHDLLAPSELYLAGFAASEILVDDRKHWRRSSFELFAIWCAGFEVANTLQGSRAVLSCRVATTVKIRFS
jgi:hypothetical protein